MESAIHSQKTKSVHRAELYIFYEPNEIAFCLPRLSRLLRIFIMKIDFFKLALRFRASRKRYWNFILCFFPNDESTRRSITFSTLIKNAWEDVEECMTFSNYVFVSSSSSSSSSKREGTELWKAIQLIEENFEPSAIEWFMEDATDFPCLMLIQCKFRNKSLGQTKSIWWNNWLLSELARTISCRNFICSMN